MHLGGFHLIGDHLEKGSSYTFKLVSAANSGKITVNNGTLEYNVN